MDATGAGLIAEQVFDYKKYELRTLCIVQVTAYDAEKNTVQVKPVRKAIRLTDARNPGAVELPPISEVLVRQYGSGKVWCTVAPAVGTYGYLHVSDRDIDSWKVSGGAPVEPTDTRCHSLRDAIFEPSLLHLSDEEDAGLLAEPIDTDRISFRTRSKKTQISVLNDESILISSEHATATIDQDGNINIENDNGGISINKDGDVVIGNEDAGLLVDIGGDVLMGNDGGTIEISSSGDVAIDGGAVSINGNLTVDP